MRRRIRWILPLSLAAVAATAFAATQAGGATRRAAATRTPIQHLVVIFQENVSFDHYFGTYPNATNADGSPFTAAPGTPSVNGLPPVNPNSAQPQRLDSSPLGLPGSPGGEITCDQDHNYNDEQRAFDNGAMDKFVETVGTSGGTTPGTTTPCDPKLVMDYYDGNTTAAYWNYAQHYAMSDNSFSPTFGPSSPGAINVVSGDTGGVDMTHTAGSVSIATAAKPNADVTSDGSGGYSLTSDAQPYWDDCSTRDAVAMKGQNVGDLLNAAGLSWGWFQGGFKPTTDFGAAAAAVGHANQPTSQFIPDEFSGSFAGKVVPAHASNQALCDAVTPVGVAVGGSGQYGFKDDYIPHHEPFEYYASTANPHHLPPASLSAIGTDTQSYAGTTPQFDTANHNYDTSDFDSLVAAINSGQLPASALPAVTFLKAPGYADGHAAYSDPADEQAFVVKEINSLMASPDWSSTAIVIAYDDSDGWYDHVYSGVTNPSQTVADALTGTGQCGTGTPLAGQQGRCGFGPRQPLLLISPCAKRNAVDSNLSDLASIPNFIEYNWGLPPIAGSFDQALASKDASEGAAFDLAGLFDFGSCDNAAVPLDPKTGQVQFGGPVTGLDLHGNTLAHGELAGQVLQGVNLQGAFLYGTDLQGAKLQGVNLQGADLTNANLSGASLKGANTNKAVWSNTTCPDGTNSNADGGSCQGHLT